MRKQATRLCGILVFVACVAASVTDVGAQATVALPIDVARFVEPDAKAVELEKGDVNGDGIKDYLLVVEHPVRRGAASLGDRDLLILVGQRDGSLRLAGRNDSLIECSACGGQAGGFRVTPSGNGFSVFNTVGSAGVHASVEFRFKYVSREHGWILVEVDNDSDDPVSDPAHPHERHVARPYEKGQVIRFDAVKGDEYCGWL